ncbi:MAG: hypothetical protein MUE41_18315, partial [Gemmatimonadaceae bacterium]|nr:hypothetical protein [Gemmatimonadaceae bacterium]
MTTPVTFPPPSPMYRLTLLGPPSLRDRSGREITAISGSPERLLLLAWLACEEPVSFHKRDTLLDRFFPDGDRDVRRNALRQALHALRTYIDPAIFVARGSDELMLNSALLSCDLTEVRARLRANDTVDRDGIGTFVDGVDTATLPVPVRSWVHDRRTEVSAIQDGTAEYPVVVAEP